MRLIDADALEKSLEKLWNVHDDQDFANKDVWREIKNAPTIEPERKIIYCKDCRFAHLTTDGEVKYCDVWFPETKTYLSADDFCSSAEKRGE